jgi:hypothetical protein
MTQLEFDADATGAPGGMAAAQLEGFAHKGGRGGGLGGVIGADGGFAPCGEAPDEGLNGPQRQREAPGDHRGGEALHGSQLPDVLTYRNRKGSRHGSTSAAKEW